MFFARAKVVQDNAVEMVGESQARAVEVDVVQERDEIAAETNPVSEMVIAFDADGNISFDGGPVDLQLSIADSSLFVLHVDNQCSFEHVSRVLSMFDENWDQAANIRHFG